MFKVLHVLGCLDPGGVEIWLLNLLRIADPKEMQFTFCCLSNKQGSLEAETEKLGGRIIHCPRDRGLRRFRRAFRGLLEAERYDVVHSHVFLFSGVILKLARQAAVPVRVAHSQNDLSPPKILSIRKAYQITMRRQILRHGNRWVADSGKAANALFGQHPPEPVRVHRVPVATDIRKFSGLVPASQLRTEFGIAEDAQVIGHVGSLSFQKNHSYLLKIFSLICRERSNTVLVLVGQGPDKAKLQQQARDLGVHEKVIFAGKRFDVPSLMTNLFDLFVFPSRYEGLGLVIVEAQCAELPTLLSDRIPQEVALVPELLTWRSIDESPRQWAEAAVHLLEQPRPSASEGRGRAVVAASPFEVRENIMLLRDIYEGKNTPRTNKALWST